MGEYLRHITACNQHDPSRYLPLMLAGKLVGRVRPAFARQLLDWPELFLLQEGVVELHFDTPDLRQRSAQLADVVFSLLEQGVVTQVHGELYAVTPSSIDCAEVLLDRAVAPYFGIRAFGQHINGFVRSDDGLKMWIGRRAEDRVHYPGHLDHIAAGGLPHGITMENNLLKECREEAGIPAPLASNARPVGAVSYYMDTDKGFKPDTLFCYDLELPEEFIPRCTDGEVAEFKLLPVEEVMELVKGSDQFKLNCNLVLIDFFIRHGLVDPSSSDYLALQEGLRPQMPPASS